MGCCVTVGLFGSPLPPLFTRFIANAQSFFSLVQSEEHSCHNYVLQLQCSLAPVFHLYIFFLNLPEESEEAQLLIFL